MKRFTDTEIWAKPWFRKLPPHVKELWRWLCDHCDHAGVIDPDLEAASFFIGETVTAEDLTRFNGNIEPFKGKWRIPGFIPFQYGKLSSLCKPHKPVFEALERHGIGIEYPIEGFQVATRKLQEKEKVQEKEKEGGGVEGGDASVTPCNAVTVTPALHPKGENHSLSAVQKFKAQMVTMYNRRNILVWPQDEEYAMAEIVLRPDWESELEELKEYRPKAGKYFPGSVSSLLNGWDKALDNARREVEFKPKSAFAKEMEAITRSVQNL